MAVKVHCNICEKFIKDVDKYDFQKLTGEEICTKCGKKVSEMYDKLNIMVDEFKKELELKQKRMKQVTGAFTSAIKNYNDFINSFQTTRTAELDNRMKDILGGKK